MQKIWLALLFLLGFAQCTNKLFSLQNLPKQFVALGSHGGFASASNSYFFFPNGQWFINQGMIAMGGTTGDQEIEKNSPKDFKQLVKSLKKMDFQDLELNEIGNMTYFIKLKTAKKEKLVQWRNMDTAPKALVTEVYRSILKNINTAAIN